MDKQGYEASVVFGAGKLNDRIYYIQQRFHYFRSESTPDFFFHYRTHNSSYDSDWFRGVNILAVENKG